MSARRGRQVNCSVSLLKKLRLILSAAVFQNGQKEAKRYSIRVCVLTSLEKLQHLTGSFTSLMSTSQVESHLLRAAMSCLGQSSCLLFKQSMPPLDQEYAMMYDFRSTLNCWQQRNKHRFQLTQQISQSGQAKCTGIYCQGRGQQTARHLQPCVPVQGMSKSPAYFRDGLILGQ